MSKFFLSNGLKENQIFQQKLSSPAQIEKVFKKNKASEGAWNDLQSQIYTPIGAPMVLPKTLFFFFSYHQILFLGISINLYRPLFLYHPHDSQKDKFCRPQMFLQRLFLWV